MVGTLCAQAWGKNIAVTGLKLLRFPCPAGAIYHRYFGCQPQATCHQRRYSGAYPLAEGFSEGQKRVWLPRSPTLWSGWFPEEGYYIATARIYIPWWPRRSYSAASMGTAWVTTRNHSDIRKHAGILYWEAPYRGWNYKMFQQDAQNTS